MHKFTLTDRFVIPVSDRNYTDEGYLIAPAKIARPGIQMYLGAELMGSPDFPKDKFDAASRLKVWRPPEEVFNKQTIDSFKNVPITNNHPKEGLLNARTYRKDNVGTVMSDVNVDPVAQCMVGTLKIMDYEAVNAVKGGKVEMSAGYVSYIMFESGVTPDGEEYDAIQRGIEGNHVAIVDKGRAGPQMKIADTNEKVDSQDAGMSKKGMMYLKYDENVCKLDAGSKAYDNIMKMMEAEDTASEFIREFKTEKDETRREMEDGTFFGFQGMRGKENYMKGGDYKKEKEKYMDTAKELAELKLNFEKLEKENIKLKAEADVSKQALADAQAKIPSVDAIDGLVKERSDIIEKSKALIGEVETKGLSNTEIKRKVVAEKLPHIDSANAEALYIDAAFDTLIPEEKPVKNSLPKALNIKDSDIPADPMQDMGNFVSRREARREEWLKSLKK